MFIVSGQTSNARYPGIPPPTDWPRNTFEEHGRGNFERFKATKVVKVYEPASMESRYGRRALMPGIRPVDNEKEPVWPTGAVWLMVRAELVPDFPFFHMI